MHALDPTMVLRDVQERARCAFRRDGHTGGSEGERGVHQNSGPLRTGARWHQQQQLCERRADRGHRCTKSGPGCMGGMGPRL